MEFPHETSLLAKAIWSVAIVLGLAAVAERVSTRIAGILSGAPLNTALVYFFVGGDMGAAYVVESTPHGIAAIMGTLAFVLAYYAASSWLPRYAAIGGVLVALAVFVAVAVALVAIPFTLASAAVATLCAIALALWLFRGLAVVPVARPVRYTARLLLLRGGLAALFVVAITEVAEALGTRWTGLMTGFPTTLLPTLLILHLTYGSANAHAIIRNFPLGIGSIILYIASVSVTFPQWGVYGGTAASLLVSLSYLTAVMLWGRGRLSRAA